MTLKNILVAFTGSDPSITALQVAKLMSEKYGCHITGVLAHGLPNVVYSYGSHLPQNTVDQINEADTVHRSEVRAKFDAVVKGMPADKVHFIEIYGDADDKLMQVAHSFDLIVMGPSDVNSGFQHMEVHPDTVARNSGRPVLVVPADYNPANFNDHALIAWDGRRAAGRALADAMTIFPNNAKMTVLTICRADDAAEKTASVMEHLSRHGIDANLIQRERKGKKVAKIIQDTAAESGAGLVVMGAYQHSKLAEDLFGGVTNKILATSKVPVLLSH
ncbi:MAG: universal stress protein [Rhodobacteraceae bacterium]|nr:universal stress protein [Paracoccaceae bacterium]